MLQTLENAARIIFTGGYKISHQEIKERFGISDKYAPDLFLPTSLLYQALTIDLGSTREEIDSLSGAQCRMDLWFKSTFPNRYARQYPAIEPRGGVIFGSADKTVEAKRFGYKEQINIGPQIAYQYYQSGGLIGGVPKLGILILDGVDPSQAVIDGKYIGNDQESTWSVKRPVRFALIARLSLDAPEHTTLKIDNIRVDGKVIPLNNKSVLDALNYGQSLYASISQNSDMDFEAAEFKYLRQKRLRRMFASGRVPSAPASP